MTELQDKESLAREQLANLMLHALKNKEKNVQAIIDGLALAEQTAKNMPKFIEAVDQGKTSNKELAQMVRTLAKVAGKQAETMRQMSVFMLVLVSTQGFDSAAAELAIKLGKGDEAIRQFAKNKFGSALGGER